MKESIGEIDDVFIREDEASSQNEDGFDPSQWTFSTNALGSPPPALPTRKERMLQERIALDSSESELDGAVSQGNDFALLEALLESQPKEVSPEDDDTTTEEEASTEKLEANVPNDTLMDEAVAQIADTNAHVTRAVANITRAADMFTQSTFAQFWNVASCFSTTSQGVALLVASNAFATRSDCVFGQRLRWDEFASRFGHQTVFSRHIRMRLDSFNKLLSYVFDLLSVDESQGNRRGGVIIPEISLFCAIRYLAGASYTDVFFGCGISKTAFYNAVWTVLGHLVTLPQLRIKFPISEEECSVAAEGFRSISDGDAILNCVAVLDGYLLRTLTPRKSEVSNVRQYYSGHYSCYGVNIQAAFDHNSRFVYLAVAGPGSLGDRDAVFECKLGRYIENLPGIYCAIGDCAYTPTEHMVPVFGGAQALNQDNDNFNFYASQLRIRAEMGFGLMREKFGILQQPLKICLRKVRILMPAIARLHNFCINERLARSPNSVRRSDENHGFTVYEQSVRDAAALGQLQEQLTQDYPQWSLNRDNMVRRVKAKRLVRPYANRRTRN